MLKDLGFVAVDWLSFMANGGCGLRYGGFVGFFWIWVLLLRWWLWLAEVLVMAEDDDETALGELCYIFFFSLSCYGFFFFYQFLFGVRERGVDMW